LLGQVQAIQDAFEHHAHALNFRQRKSLAIFLFIAEFNIVDNRQAVLIAL
jgi:hypothetical protein